MDIFASPDDTRKKVISLREAGNRIGFVPTMGALHTGHEQLIKKSVQECDITVVSIFVNPLQFNNPIDYEKYPITWEEDVKRLETAGCDLLFAPRPQHMYPHPPKVSIAFPPLQNSMEGKHRPGHFEGVALVVSKLFHTVPAHIGYFGQKDWQQFQIIRQLVSDLAFDIEVASVATVREEDGLAMSSRNQRLSVEGRQKAAVFYRMLKLAQRELKAGRSVIMVKNLIKEEMSTVGGVELEYFEIANSETLQPVERVEGGARSVSLFIAGYIDGVRLIDNIFLEEEIA